jgi:hypothetical protein
LLNNAFYNLHRPIKLASLTLSARILGYLEQSIGQLLTHFS